jgi:hypothetical protein
LTTGINRTFPGPNLKFTVAGPANDFRFLGDRTGRVIDPRQLCAPTALVVLDFGDSLPNVGNCRAPAVRIWRTFTDLHRLGNFCSAANPAAA